MLKENHTKVGVFHYCVKSTSRERVELPGVEVSGKLYKAKFEKESNTWPLLERISFKRASKFKYMKTCRPIREFR